MNPLSPIFALVIFLIAFCTAFFLGKKKSVVLAGTSSSKRYESIDGLRGFLAISVFIYHTSIWYTYLQTDNWDIPDSNFFAQLGQTGVAFFFMISSFLFVNRLIEYKGDQFNWITFFIKRFFRLAPLHFAIVLIIIGIAFYETNWILAVDYFDLTKSLVQWFSFGILNVSEINGFADTWMINAGVLWSLPYEWLLYFSLPLLSLLILKKKPPVLIVILSIAFIVFTHQFRAFYLEHLLSFTGGALAPIILKYNKKTINFNHYLFTLTAIASLLGIVQFSSSSNLFCKLFITISFTLFALGNDLFGLLKSSTLKLLGDISYSTYLLHGVVLYVCINYFYGIQNVQNLSQLEYCLFIFTISPIVVLLSFMTYRYIEVPFIRVGRSLTNRL